MAKLVDGVTVQDGIPVANGRPAAKISTGFTEKIGLPNYSNVEVYASITQYVPDGTQEELLAHIHNAAAVTETFIAEFRQEILKMRQEAAKA